MVIPQRETRANRGPILKTYIVINETMCKPPVFYLRGLRIKLSMNNRSIDNIVKFKTAIRKDMNFDCVAEKLRNLLNGDVYLKTAISIALSVIDEMR